MRKTTARGWNGSFYALAAPICLLGTAISYSDAAILRDSGVTVRAEVLEVHDDNRDGVGFVVSAFVSWRYLTGRAGAEDD